MAVSLLAIKCDIHVFEYNDTKLSDLLKYIFISLHEESSCNSVYGHFLRNQQHTAMCNLHTIALHSCLGCNLGPGIAQIGHFPRV